MTSESRKIETPSAKAPTEKLKHPSVVEAVCEFRFGSGASYTLVPGAMMERLRSRFPEHETLPTAALMSGVADNVMLPAVPLHRFKSREPNVLVQTGPRLLTINILPVYPSFEVFREIILAVLSEYRGVATPGNPTRIGLRYINHLASSGGGGMLSDYVNYELSYPKNLPHLSKETSARLVFSYGDLGSLALAVAFPSQMAQRQLGALLDLDFSLNDPKDFDLNRFPEWLDEAHTIIYEAFVSAVRKEVMSEMRGEKRA